MRNFISSQGSLLNEAEHAEATDTTDEPSGEYYRE
jgi:hypothetical protein